MIVVAGEALVDMIPSLDEEEGSRFVAVPGGSPFNVALALGRLGCRPRFLCGFSRDAFGRMLRQTLEDSGVDLNYCLPAKGLTTLGFVTEGPSGTPEYAFYTSGTAGCALSMEEIPDALPPEVEAIHFGSFSLGVEPFGAALESLCQRESGKRFISLDPNIRPFLVSDRKKYEARLERFLGAADLIKASEEDLAWLDPEQSIGDFAQGWLNRGAGLVVITRGEQGASAFCWQGQVNVAGETVDVVDTVGAGDTFQASLLSGLGNRGLLDRDAIRNVELVDVESILTGASHAAAINCTRRGCDPPTREELNPLQ